MHLIDNSKAAVQKAAAVAVRVAKVASRRRPLLWPTWQSLPVSGIDAPAAQSVLYALRRGLPGADVSSCFFPTSSPWGTRSSPQMLSVPNLQLPAGWQQ